MPTATMKPSINIAKYAGRPSSRPNDSRMPLPNSGITRALSSLGRRTLLGLFLLLFLRLLHARRRRVLLLRRRRLHFDGLAPVLAESVEEHEAHADHDRDVGDVERWVLELVGDV